MTPSDIAKELATHFVVKDGARKNLTQYGHLELWWAGKSVHEEPDAGKNPWMLVASAESSYSLACMNHLRGIIEAANQVCR